MAYPYPSAEHQGCHLHHHQFLCSQTETAAVYVLHNQDCVDNILHFFHPVEKQWKNKELKNNQICRPT